MVSGHVIEKAESSGVLCELDMFEILSEDLLAARLKWLLCFYHNRAEALNLVSSLKNTKRGNIHY